MPPFLQVAERCGACGRSWLHLSTKFEREPDVRCWACGSADVTFTSPPKRCPSPLDQPRKPPDNAVESEDEKAPRRRANDPGHGPQE